jgi:hypothetical protein
MNAMNEITNEMMEILENVLNEKNYETALKEVSRTIFCEHGYMVLKTDKKCVFCGQMVYEHRTSRGIRFSCSVCKRQQTDKMVKVVKEIEKVELEPMTLSEILKDLVDNLETETVTMLEIGKALLAEKKNNEENVNWMKMELANKGYKVVIRR